MNVTTFSVDRLKETMRIYCVDDAFSDTLINYLVHGLQPGSFFTGVIANDFNMAIQSSHVGNRITSLKYLCCWIDAVMPAIAKGSHAAVDDWCHMNDRARRSVLEEHQLIYTEQEEILLVLQD